LDVWNLVLVKGQQVQPGIMRAMLDVCHDESAPNTESVIGNTVSFNRI